ncbi:MAG: M20/M25/M40 family metallo-hydrolase [Nanoarchaeota archaeon]
MKNNESRVGDFIFSYLKKFKFLKLEKQSLGNGRKNIIARTKGKPKILIAGHMDTVVPKRGGFNPFSGRIDGDRLYGLGSLDTKGGISSLLSVIGKMSDLQKTTLLFYCDEEYDFHGMKKFVTSLNRKELPELALVIEPTNLNIWNAHRGLIEIRFSILGKSGHSANPKGAKNSNLFLMYLVNSIQNTLLNFKHPFLGLPSFNVSYMHGGLYRGNRDHNPILGNEGNNIPDYTEAVFEIRTTKIELNAERIKGEIKRFALAKGFEVNNFQIRHDLAPLFTDPRRIKNLITAVKEVNEKAKILDPSIKGYSDGQIIDQYLKIPVVYLGPGGDGMHASSEYVSISSLRKLENIYSNIFKHFDCI